MTLGKFLASMVFYVSALAGTLVLPLMLVLLGDPDLGPIFGAYLGSLLLGAFFLSLGLFVSAMCRDQIVAFMLTLLGCFGFYLAGTEFVVTLAEAAWPGLGSLLAAAVGRHAALPDLHPAACWCWATSCISSSGRWSGWCSTACFWASAIDRWPVTASWPRWPCVSASASPPTGCSPSRIWAAST